MRFYTRAKRPLVINIVSLIDILAILLIFFVVTTTFKKAEPQVEIKLPESDTATEEEQSFEPVIIHVTKDGLIFIDDAPVTLETLTTVMRERAAAMRRPAFALRADEDVNLGFFVKVLDASKNAGIPNLSLFTEPRPQN